MCVFILFSLEDKLERIYAQLEPQLISFIVESAEGLLTSWLINSL